MGVEQELYLGIYIVIKPLEHAVVNTVEKCHLHPKKSIGCKFCPVCGAKTANLELKPTIEYKGYWDMRDDGHFSKYREDEYDHQWHHDLKEVLIPNEGFGIVIPENNDGTYPIKLGDVTIYNSRFVNQRKDFIKELEEVFGEENVTIEYGVVNYWR